MDLAKEYREIAELLSGKGRKTSQISDSVLLYSEDGKGGYTNLYSIDGLMEVWDEYCKPHDWAWTKDCGFVRGLKSGNFFTHVCNSGNFHADFCRLLVAVLREINSTHERTKGS